MTLLKSLKTGYWANSFVILANIAASSIANETGNNVFPFDELIRSRRDVTSQTTALIVRGKPGSRWLWSALSQLQKGRFNTADDSIGQTLLNSIDWRNDK